MMKTKVSNITHFNDNQDIFSESAVFKYKPTMETINTTISRMASVRLWPDITYVGGMYKNEL